MSPRGCRTFVAKRTRPLSRPKMAIDVARDDRDTSAAAVPKSCSEKRRAASTQKTKPRPEFANSLASTQPPNRVTCLEAVSDVGVSRSSQGNSQLAALTYAGDD